MKVKELERFAHSAWSPLSNSRTYLATITAEDNRQSNDSLTDSGVAIPSALEIFEFDVKENNSMSMQSNISLQIKQKGTCLLWTAPIGDLETGLLIYGTITGSLYLYNSQKIVSTYHQHKKSSLIDDNNQENIIDFNENTIHHHVNGDQHKWNTTKPSITIAENDLSSFIYTSRENVHNGVVRSLDFNRFQTNLFASVSNDDEIFIWDIEKMEQPMSPGAKIQPVENLNKVAWNPRVQHILCTTSIGRCVIWDLRKSGPVLQLTKTMCQLEPQIMAWSPDVATRLCLTDPNNPNADIQLWDLRYPKHMLALLGHWPPIASHTTSQLAGFPLGNAGTVNSLCWGIPECQKSTNYKSHLYDTDMIMTVIGASGALPTLSGTCGTKLNPTYAEMLVVWSVDQALNSSPDTDTSHEATPQPIFISRLEGLEDQELASGLCFNDLPTNMSVHCVPNYPNLLCVTQSDGWITIHNLSSGLTHQKNPQHEQVNVERYAKQCKLARNSQSMRTSHKVAEAFNDGESLITLDDNIHENKALNESDSLYPVSMDNSGITGSSGSGFTDDQQMVNPLIEQLSNDSSYSMKPIIHTIPQPMPLLRVAPCWLKKPCGVNFAFGGRLVIFSSLSQLSTKRTRTLSSMTLKRGDHSKSPETTATGEHQQSITIPSSDHQHQSIPAESQAYWVSIKWIDLSQLESSGDSVSQQLVDNNSSTQEFIDCITNALNCPMEYLLTVCDKAKQLLQTHNYQPYLDLWNVIHARLGEPSSVKLSLSKLFGYDKSDHQDFTGWTTDQLLETLKRSLVTGDIHTTIQLCLHPDFASLSLPNLSTLSVFGVMLADSHRTDQPQVFCEVQTKILTMLNDFPIKHTASSCLNSVIMLFNGVLCKNWLTLVNNWPLSDWRTILSAIVNHLWDQDVELFKNLCSLIVKRLLDNSDDDGNANKDMKEIHKDLSSNEVGLVACVCCIISGDLDGLTQCWLRLNNIDISQLDDVTKILPLALQLVLLHRVSQTNNNYCQDQFECLQSNQLLMSLAIWLADTRGGQCENNLILALNLLTKTISSSSLSTRNDLIDLRHRLWCNLSVEQQQQQYQQYCQQASSSSELQQLFQCPYPQTGCHCGLSQSNPSLVMTNKATHHQKAMHAQQSSMSTIFPSSTQNLPPQQPHLHPQPLLQQPIQSTNNFYAPLPSANISNQPLFPSQGMQLQPPLPPPPPLPAATQQPQPYFPSSQNMPFEQCPPAPPPPPPSAFSHPSMPSVIEQTRNIQLNANQQHASPMPNVVKPPIPSLSTPMNTNIGNNIPANYQSPFNNMPSSTAQYGVQHQLQSQQSVPLPPPPPASHQQQPLQRRQTSTSPGWNDPPLLSMNKPPQSAVSHNPYYNPMEFTSSSISQLNSSLTPGAGFPRPVQPSMPPLPPSLQTAGSALSQPNVPYPSSMNNSIPSMNTSVPPRQGQPQPQLPPMPPSQPSFEQLPPAKTTPVLSPPLSVYPQMPGGGVYQQYQPQQHQLQQQQPDPYPQQFQNTQFSPSPSSLAPRQASSTSSTIWPAAPPLCSIPKTSIDSTPYTDSNNILTSNSSPDGSVNVNTVSQTSNVNSDTTTTTPANSSGNDVCLLPEEYNSIRKVLIDLIYNCRQTGGKQYRNKLDDVERRLDQFFKNISTGTLQLTGSTFECLQQCTLLAEQFNYTEALKQVNLLIQSAFQLPDIQCFGPALKILMQTAKQLYPTSSPTSAAAAASTSASTPVNQYPVVSHRIH